MTRRELRALIRARMVERGMAAERHASVPPVMLTLHPEDWEDLLLEAPDRHDPGWALLVSYPLPPEPPLFSGIPVTQSETVPRGEVVLTWPAG